MLGGHDGGVGTCLSTARRSKSFFAARRPGSFFSKKRSANFLHASPPLLIQVNAPRPKIRFP
jgi:hypothetical protein